MLLVKLCGISMCLNGRTMDMEVCLQKVDTVFLYSTHTLFSDERQLASLLAFIVAASRQMFGYGSARMGGGSVRSGNCDQNHLGLF